MNEPQSDEDTGVRDEAMVVVVFRAAMSTAIQNAGHLNTVVLLSGFSSDFTLTSKHAAYLAEQQDTPVVAYFWSCEASAVL